MNLLQWLLGVVLVSAVGWRVRHEPWTLSRVAGAAILLLAFVLVSVARLQLGRSFSVRARARRLVTTGLYAKIRNPIYVFGTLALVGVALMLLAWWPALLIGPAVIVQGTRARREAAALQAAFGEEYRRYRRSTWF